MTNLQQKILNWLANGETGLSSETLAFWAGFGIRKAGVSHPHDPADFNRCLKLLKVAPALRKQLPKMSALSPEWARLVARWSDIEAMLIEEVGVDWKKGGRVPATNTYALMKEIIDGPFEPMKAAA